MSGQPNLYPSDAIKYRGQYMANLNLQARNDDINLQANKIFKKTGQTPSQPTDTRSTTDKLADVERLKIDLRASLAQIADGQEAQAIVNHIAQNAGLLEFVAQHIDEILNMSKGKWKYGVKADVFIPFVERYRDSYRATQGINIGLQEATGQQILLGVQDIQLRLLQPADLNALRLQIEGAMGLMGTGLSTALIREIDTLKALIPNQAILERIINVKNTETQEIIIRYLNGALKQLASKNEVAELGRQLAIAISHNDAGAAQSVGTNVLGMLTVSPTAKQELGAAASLLGGGGATPPPSVKAEPFKMITKKADLEKLNQEQLWIQYSNGNDKLNKDMIKQIINFFWKNNPIENGWPAGKTAYTTATKQQLTDYLDANKVPVELAFEGGFSSGGGGGGGAPPTTGMTVGASPPSLGAVVASQGNPPTGKGIKGRGIAVDYSKGVQDTNKAKYVPFGKFIINPKRLEDDIIAVRRPKGSVPIPTQRTSQKLGGVIRKIVGGGSPTFEDLNALNEDEKHYLHKLMKTTNLIDRINVPAPSKEQNDKDINRFEVLRGEIMSGNDSHQLIKEFKLLILKLVNKELLPKSQSREILYDLMALGF